MFLHPFARHLDPGFADPTKNPLDSLSLEIRWEDSITKDLHSAYVLDTFSVRDITGRVPQSAIAVNGSQIALESRPVSKALTWDGSDNNQVNLDIVGQPYDFHTSSTMSYSILHYFTFEGDTNSSAEDTLSASTTIAVFDLLSVAVSIEDGLPHCLLVTRDESFYRAYLDGVQIDATISTSGRGNSHLLRYQSNINSLELFTGATATSTYEIGGTPQAGNDRWAGPIYTSQFWQRALSPTEARFITRNPWSVYKNRLPIPYFTPAGVPGITPQIVVPNAQRIVRHSGRYF